MARIAIHPPPVSVVAIQGTWADHCNRQLLVHVHYSRVPHLPTTSIPLLSRDGSRKGDLYRADRGGDVPTKRSTGWAMTAAASRD